MELGRAHPRPPQPVDLPGRGIAADLEHQWSTGRCRPWTGHGVGLRHRAERVVEADAQALAEKVDLALEALRRVGIATQRQPGQVGQDLVAEADGEQGYP